MRVLPSIYPVPALLTRDRRAADYGQELGLSHIDDSSLELYALGRVSQFEVVAIEEHLLVCPYCNERLRSIEEFALTLRDAAQIMATELIATHRTHDGLVHLYVRRTGINSWVSTIRGETIGGGANATTREQAVQQCQVHFSEMFPEHVCGRGCTASS